MMQLNMIRNLLTTAVLVAFAMAFVQAQPNEKASNPRCEEAIDEAKRNFASGNFQELLKLLDEEGDCYKYLRSSKGRAEKMSTVHKIKAKTYLALDQIEEAKKEIQRILDIDNLFTTSELEDSKLFIETFEEVKLQREKNLISSVSKKAEDLDLVAANIVILTEEDLRSRGYNDLEELFHDLPGFDVVRGSGYSYSNIFQRGYRSAYSTNRTLILIDGIEDNSLFSNTAFISRQYPLSNIKRVEIIYGPASTMYGLNAFLGVINIVTKNRNDLFSNNNKLVSVSSNSGYGLPYNTYYSDVTAGIHSKAVDLIITGRYFHSDERDLSEFSNWDNKFDLQDKDAYRTKLTLPNATNDILNFFATHDSLNLYHTVSNNTTVIPTDFAVQAAMKADSVGYYSFPVSYKNPTDDHFIGMKLRINDLYLALQHWENKEGVAIGSDNFYAADNHLWRSSQSFIYLRYDKDITSNLKLFSTSRYVITQTLPSRVTTYQSYLYGTLTLKDLSTASSTSWNRGFFYRNHSQLQTELNAVYTPTEFLEFTGGVEYRNSSLQGTTLTLNQKLTNLPFYNEDSLFTLGATSSLLGGDQIHINDFSFFAQGTSRYKDFRFTLGGRFDRSSFKNIPIENFSGRVAVVHKKELSSGSLVSKLFYANVFRYPTPFERYERSYYNNTVLVKTPDLIKSEKASNYELSFKYFNPNRTFTAEAVGYWMQSQNASIEAPNNYRFIYSGIVRIRGVQLQLNYNWGDTDLGNFSFYANYSYTYGQLKWAEDSTYIPIGDIAPHKLNFGWTGHLLKNKFTFHLRGNYVSSRPTGAGTSASLNALSSIDKYLIFHANFGYEISKYITFQVTVNNLLDNNVLIPGQEEYFHPGMRQSDDKAFAAQIPQNRRVVLFKILFDL